MQYDTSCRVWEARCDMMLHVCDLPLISNLHQIEPLVCRLPVLIDKTILVSADGNVDVNAVKGEKTATGAQKETFGTGSAAQSEAGKKGGAISGMSGLCQVKLIQRIAVSLGLKPQALTQHTSARVLS